ncbi:MAG: DHH family phosphoesterase, partial [Eubacteriales bacterium]
MKKEKKWIIREQNEAEVSALCDTLGISDVTARVLCNRGYGDPQKAKIFIEKSESFLHNPFLLKDMDKAVLRIQRAIENNEKITVYGDYDADGVMSVSVLLRYFRDQGIKADFYIPSRESEGYGISNEALDFIAKNGTKLIITVDTGITAMDEVAYAEGLGVDMVITDHHQCPQVLPKAAAVINPHRTDCAYPYKDLAGVGVAFKLICALELARENNSEYSLDIIKDMCRSYISLAAIGTIADVMPMTGENRIIIHIGLHLLRGTEDVSMKSLFSAAGIEIDSGHNKKSILKNISVSSVAFGVAPRINAAG